MSHTWRVFLFLLWAWNRIFFNSDVVLLILFDALSVQCSLFTVYIFFPSPLLQPTRTAQDFLLCLRAHFTTSKFFPLLLFPFFFLSPLLCVCYQLLIFYPGATSISSLWTRLLILLIFLSPYGGDGGTSAVGGWTGKKTYRALEGVH